MLVQPFVENAILHGIANLSVRGKIDMVFSIKEGKMHVAVTDNGVGRNNLEKGQEQKGKQHHSLGTQLTRERLALLSDQYHQKYDFIISDIEKTDAKSSGIRVDLFMPFEVE